MPTKPKKHKPISATRQPKRQTWRHTATPAERGYGSEWKRLRKRILRRDGFLCQPCKRAGRRTEGREVDHLKPKHLGGTDTPSNLQTICTLCHKRKTAQEAKDAKKGGAGASSGQNA